MPDIAARHLPVSDEDMRFQRRLWRVERAFWWVQLAIVLGALAGLAGGGPLSRGEAENGGLAVAYARIARSDSPGEMTLSFAPGLVGGGEASVAVDAGWLSGVELERIVPEPEHSAAEPGAIRFTFRAAEGSPIQVRILFHHRAVGRRTCRLEARGGPPLNFAQWVYP